MFIDSINLNALRVFEAVFRRKSMTEAAKELGLTQSGVSQHIEKLENQLGVTLFDRINRKLHPTLKGKVFYGTCNEILNKLEENIVNLSGSQFQYEGEIIIGLPIEFGNTFILPLVPEIKKIFPKMNFKFQYGFAAEINQLLLEDKMDLAFVDAFIMDSRIKLETVYTETHHLVCSKKFAKNKNIELVKESIENLECVAYLDNAPIIQGWLKKELGDQKYNLNIVSKSMDVAGVATLIKAGVGFGLLPEHAINKYLSKNEIVYLKDKELGQKNDISLAYIESKSERTPIKNLIEFFLDKAK